MALGEARMEGAVAAMRETRPPGKVALIVNELTGVSRAALLDGLFPAARRSRLA